MIESYLRTVGIEKRELYDKQENSFLLDEQFEPVLPRTKIFE